MIDHAEARELLELAAVEPAGLDRLAAGDTPEASALAGHLAGCPACAAEAERIRASAGLIRDVVIESPPPELRERTLALVREVGRRRDAPVAAVALATATGPAAQPVPASLPGGRSGSSVAARRKPFRSIAWPAAMAAAIVLAVIGTAVVVNNRNAADLAQVRETAGELARLAGWSLQISAQPDSQQVKLASAPGSDASGTLLYSPTTTELVVVARDLPAAPAGQQYRCWVEVAGARKDIGQMDTGAGLAYWAGRVKGLGDLPPGTPFGVSLADVNGPIDPGPPVLSGSISQ